MILERVPQAQWERLEKARGLPTLLPWTAPEDVSVIAVKDDNGEFVGCVMVQEILHIEGLWVAPKWRGNPGVGRRLMRAALSEAKGRTRSTFAMAEIDPEAGNGMREILERVGGERVPVETYLLDLRS